MGSALSQIGVPSNAEALSAALEGLTSLNRLIMRRQEIPPLRDSGVVYACPPFKVWRHCAEVGRSGWGDCESLSAWRAAELNVTGEDPEARVFVYRSGPHKYHAIVERGDGTLEDPSVEHGMNPPRWWREYQRDTHGEDMYSNQPIVIGGVDVAPHNPYPTQCIVRGNDGMYRGHIRVPCSDGTAVYGVTSPSRSVHHARRKTHAVIGAFGELVRALSHMHKHGRKHPGNRMHHVVGSYLATFARAAGQGLQAGVNLTPQAQAYLMAARQARPLLKMARPYVKRAAHSAAKSAGERAGQYAADRALSQSNSQDAGPPEYDTSPDEAPQQEEQAQTDDNQQTAE